MSDHGYGNSGGRPRRIPLRLLIGVGIAIFAVISYFMKTSTNPVTGEKQRVSLTVEQEKALGLQAAPEMAQEMGGAIDPARDPQAALVAEVGQRILERSDANKPENPYLGNFNFYLLNDQNMINAFALPGGQIFITRALYDKLENEAQLAGVLGHEIGHVINRHAAEHMAKGQLGGALVTAVGVGASEDQRSGAYAAMAAQIANQMFQMKFSRNDESESDRYGLKYMSQAGYNPRAMLKVMEVLRDASKGGRTPEIMATHPMPETRLQEIEQKIKEMFPNGVPGELTDGRKLE